MSAAPTPDPRIAKSKAAVLASAAELLAEHGMNGATVDAVAIRSGVAKTTIYRHWPDRDALLLDAIRVMAPPCEDPASGDTRTDLLQQLHSLARALCDTDYGRALPSIIDTAAKDRGVSRLLAQFGEERRRAMQVVLRRAVAAGELASDTDVKLLNSLLVGPVFYRSLLNRTKPSRRQLEQIVTHVLAGAQAAGRESQCRP